MELLLKRTDFSDECTISDLYVNNIWECFVLEDKTRDTGVKIPGETSIPYGRYEIIITYSNRFKKPLPLLLNVPMFEGIRIHSGNKAVDSSGCLLTGTKKTRNSVLNSKIAFKALFKKIQEAINAGEKVFIEIVKSQQVNYIV